MSGLEKTFPDVERALIRGLPAALTGMGRPGVTAGDITPEDLDAKAVAGFLRISLIDDPDDTITRRALVDVDCFATTRAVAYDVAQKVRAILLSSRSLDGVVLDRVSTQSGPKRVPWDNTNIRRMLATYRISTRR